MVSRLLSVSIFVRLQRNSGTVFTDEEAGTITLVVGDSRIVVCPIKVPVDDVRCEGSSWCCNCCC
jgi:hypothetical protein